MKRFARWASLVPLAILIVAACSSPAPESYSGVQSRTPIDKIPAGGQMKNFTLVATNPLLDPKFNLPPGANGRPPPVTALPVRGRTLPAHQDLPPHLPGPPH